MHAAARSLHGRVARSLLQSNAHVSRIHFATLLYSSQRQWCSCRIIPGGSCGVVAAAAAAAVPADSRPAGHSAADALISSGRSSDASGMEDHGSHDAAAKEATSLSSEKESVLLARQFPELQLNLPPPTHTTVKSATFIKSSVRVEDCPPPRHPEFAVIGRSNVGKSSLINMLTGRKSLAMVSKAPGAHAPARAAAV